MKKLYLLAALSAIVLGSCSKGPSGPPQGQTRFVVKLTTRSSAAARSEVPTGSTTQAKYAEEGTHYIFVIDDGNGVAYKEELDLSAMAETAGDGGGPLYFPNDYKVYVLANIPADVNVDELTDWAAIDIAASAISNAAGTLNDDLEYPAMGNEDGTPKGVDDQGDGTATVEIKISPLYSRLELAKVTGDDGTIKEYVVTGVFVDNYRTSYTMSGKGSGDLITRDRDAETVGLYDVGTWEGNEESSYEATPGGGNVWAYHIAPGSVATLIIRLENVTAIKEGESGPEDDPIAGTLYLTITGYSGFTGSFERGKIYQIANVAFDNSNLYDTPNPDGVIITATIEIVDWEVEPLNPVLSR